MRYWKTGRFYAVTTTALSVGIAWMLSSCEPQAPPEVPAAPQDQSLTPPSATSTNELNRPEAVAQGEPKADCGLPPSLVKRGWPRRLTEVSPQEPTAFVTGSVTMAVIPDTQYYALCRNAHFRGQSEWIAAQSSKRNIQVALHLGDITESNTHEEWQFAKHALAPLDKLPLLLATGNHDHGNGGTANIRSTLFGQYFGQPSPATTRTVAETMKPGDLENAYYRMKLGQAEIGVLSLEWSPRTATVQWARETLNKYPGDRVIVLTHAYLYFDGTRYDDGNKGSQQEWNPRAYGTARTVDGESPHPDGAYDGEMLWQELVQHHPGVFLTLNGHVLGDGVAVLSSQGKGGNLVHQMLANYQMLEEGGLGYLRLLEFLPDGKTLRAKTYSPSLGLFATSADQNFDLEIQPPLW